MEYATLLIFNRKVCAYFVARIKSFKVGGFSKGKIYINGNH